MADAKMPVPGVKLEPNRLTGLKKRQQIELAGRNMFMWVVIAAVAVSFCLATGQYMFSKWEYNNKILSAKYEAVDTLKQNIVNAKALKDEVDTLVANNDLASVKTDASDSNLKSILDALPTGSDPAALATSLQQAILNRSGVTIESVTIPPEADAVDPATLTSTPQEIRFSFIVSGSYSRIRALMHDVERTIRPIKVISVVMSGSLTSLRVTVDAVTYYQPAKSISAVLEVIK